MGMSDRLLGSESGTQGERTEDINWELLGIGAQVMEMDISQEHKKRVLGTESCGFPTVGDLEEKGPKEMLGR